MHAKIGSLSIIIIVENDFCVCVGVDMICDQIHLTMQKIPDTSYHYSDHEGVAAMFTVRRNVTGIPLLLLFGGHLYGNGICFANVAFLESIPLTPLNGSLRNFNT